MKFSGDLKGLPLLKGNNVLGFFFFCEFEVFLLDLFKLPFQSFSFCDHIGERPKVA
jgi:hypothetical protein